MDKYLEMKEKIFERINASWDELIALNDDLADHPEISGQNHRPEQADRHGSVPHPTHVHFPSAGFP